MNLSKIIINDAAFGIHGKGYSGKHIFGEKIGYPTLNKKSRWQSPGGMIYKFDWLPQTRFETRPPKSRIAFTETLPIDVFIKSCDIDWDELRKENNRLKKTIEKSDLIKVESQKSNFTVYLSDTTGKRRIPKTSDADVTSKIDHSILKRQGLKTGKMANLPGGEVFVTPEYLEGKIWGDIVISIDQSYLLDEKRPIVIRCNRKGYKILDGPKKIMNILYKKRNEAYKFIKILEKNKSVPKEIIDLSKKNFYKIGEFAINTNPSAELCNYLIVNEKIAGMIHVALGSGFESDRHTEYHYDIVINAKTQKLDIYGLKKNKKFWLVKKGKFVF